jgi:hypothetical protein
MELVMKVTGRMISSMVTEKKLGLMDQFTKANITKARSMDMVFIAGMMDQDTREIGLRIKLEV